jgi:hypothetical protein
MTDPIELGRTPACLEVEEDLPEAARALRAGEDLAARFPALARHLEECERCRAILAEMVKEPDIQAERATPIEPEERFEGYLTAALADEETIVRARAAERLGTTARLGPMALAALADLANDDPEEEVRAAAIRALDELDASVAIPRRLIEVWADAPEEAASFIEGVLARLAAEGPPVSTVAVVEPSAPSWTTHENRLNLTAEGLPGTFEKKMPVIAIPGAPLVRAKTPVAAGRLEAPVGAAATPPRRVFLIND